MFAQAFNLVPDGSPAAGKQTFSQFANQWLRTLETVPPSSIEIELTDPKPPTE